MRTWVVALLAVMATRPLAGQQRRWEVAAGAVGVLTERAIAYEGHRHTASGVGRGAEAVLGRGPVAIWARAVAMDLTAPSDTVTMAEATIGDIDLRGQLRAGGVVLEGGFVRRVVTGRFSAQTWQGLRVGGRLIIQAGTGAFFFEGGAGYCPTLRSSDAGTTGTGLDFESSLRFAPTRAPMWLAVGYRFERRELPGLTGKQFERISGVMAVGGLSFHGVSRPQR